MTAEKPTTEEIQAARLEWSEARQQRDKYEQWSLDMEGTKQGKKHAQTAKWYAKKVKELDKFLDKWDYCTDGE